MVFNTDPHNKSGSHWISLFISIPKKLIYFFDSAGDACPPQIMKLVRRIIPQGQALNISFSFDQNHPMEHQYGNTECGMYVLYFLINMVLGRLDTLDLKTQRIPDNVLIYLRNLYFIPYNV